MIEFTINIGIADAILLEEDIDKKQKENNSLVFMFTLSVFSTQNTCLTLSIFIT
jgi:hypothetical protein